MAYHWKPDLSKNANILCNLLYYEGVLPGVKRFISLCGLRAPLHKGPCFALVENIVGPSRSLLVVGGQTNRR